MKAIIILIGIMIYLIIGRIVIKYMDKNTDIDFDNTGMGLAVAFFPLVIFWEVPKYIGKKIYKSIHHFNRRRKYNNN